MAMSKQRCNFELSLTASGSIPAQTALPVHSFSRVGHMANKLPKSTSDDSHLPGDSKQSKNKHFAGMAAEVTEGTSDDAHLAADVFTYTTLALMSYNIGIQNTELNGKGWEKNIRSSETMSNQRSPIKLAFRYCLYPSLETCSNPLINHSPVALNSLLEARSTAPASYSTTCLHILTCHTYVS